VRFDGEDEAQSSRIYFAFRNWKTILIPEVNLSFYVYLIF